MILEGNKSSDPGELMVWFQSKTKGLRTRTANGVSSSFKAVRLETQGESVFQFESKGREKPMCKLKVVR